MNIKHFGILVVIAALLGIYYGSDYLSLRNHLIETLQNEPFTKKNIGQFLDVTMSKSQDAPHCSGECKGIKRYHFLMKGDVATVQMSADYDREKDQLSHRIYCNEQGDIVEIEQGVPIFICR